MILERAPTQPSTPSLLSLQQISNLHDGVARERADLQKITSQLFRARHREAELIRSPVHLLVCGVKRSVREALNEVSGEVYQVGTAYCKTSADARI
jgi:hypothetical protein